MDIKTIGSGRSLGLGNSITRFFVAYRSQEIMLTMHFSKNKTENCFGSYTRNISKNYSTDYCRIFPRCSLTNPAINLRDSFPARIPYMHAFEYLKIFTWTYSWNRLEFLCSYVLKKFSLKIMFTEFFQSIPEASFINEKKIFEYFSQSVEVMTTFINSFANFSKNHLIIFTAYPFIDFGKYFSKVSFRELTRD